MPRACRVEFHVCRYDSSEREAPPHRAVASAERISARRSNEREAPPREAVASATHPNFSNSPSEIQLDPKLNNARVTRAVVLAEVLAEWFIRVGRAQVVADDHVAV